MGQLETVPKHFTQGSVVILSNWASKWLRCNLINVIFNTVYQPNLLTTKLICLLATLGHPSEQVRDAINGNTWQSVSEFPFSGFNQFALENIRRDSYNVGLRHSNVTRAGVEILVHKKLGTAIDKKCWNSYKICKCRSRDLVDLATWQANFPMKPSHHSLERSSAYPGKFRCAP